MEKRERTKTKTGKHGSGHGRLESCPRAWAGRALPAPSGHVICIQGPPRSSRGGQRERHQVTQEAAAAQRPLSGPPLATHAGVLVPSPSGLTGHPDAAEANMVTSSADRPLSSRHTRSSASLVPCPGAWTPSGLLVSHTATRPPSAQAPWTTPHRTRDRPQRRQSKPAQSPHARQSPPRPAPPLAAGGTVAPAEPLGGDEGTGMAVTEAERSPGLEASAQEPPGAEEDGDLAGENAPGPPPRQDG